MATLLKECAVMGSYNFAGIRSSLSKGMDYVTKLLFLLCTGEDLIIGRSPFKGILLKFYAILSARN
jgi:hypothetical protein